MPGKEMITELYMSYSTKEQRRQHDAMTNAITIFITRFITRLITHFFTKLYGGIFYDI